MLDSLVQSILFVNRSGISAAADEDDVAVGHYVDDTGEDHSIVGGDECCFTEAEVGVSN